VKFAKSHIENNILLQSLLSIQGENARMKSFFVSLRTHWVRTSLIALVIIGIGYYLWKRNSASNTTPTYQTATAERGTLIVSVTGSGIVSTANNVQVTTQSSGVVETIFVKNGDQVRAGQKIAELDLDMVGQQRHSSALSTYQSAKNNVDAARSGLYTANSKMFAANQTFINKAVAQDLADSDPTYIQQNSDWLAAESDYKRQQNVITQSQSALSSAWISYQQSSAIIYAPISGTLTGFSMQQGSVITAQTTTTGSSSSQKIASVTTDAVPTISVNLTQIDVPKIKVGQKATVTLDAYADKTYTGKVVSIDTVGSVTSGVTTYPTVIALDTKSGEILPNMSAQATIIIMSKTDVLIVPSTALQSEGGETTIRIMKDGAVHSVPVETGLASDAQTEILSGISEGDTIVTTVSTGTPTTGTSSSTSVFSPFGRGAGGGGASGAVRISR
jgi:membrane fusion protein, macrolide-specific efflux system